MNKKNFIILFTVFFITSLYLVDQVFEIAYIFKVLIKLTFIILSAFLGKYFFNINFSFLKFKTLKRYKLGIYISIFTFFIIFLGFIIVRNFMDFETLKYEFIHKYHLDGLAFFIASFYLIFINSFIEEYFFRGFIYKNIEKKTFANAFSSISFSIYHLPNFQNWFNNPIFLLFPLIGLIIGGLLFNYLVSESDDIYNSYIPHMFADMSLVIIGYFLIIK